MPHSAAVGGLTCSGGVAGKCEPPPLPPPPAIRSRGVQGALVWEGIEVLGTGSYDVCYCDRHYGNRCAIWLQIGSLTAQGPVNVGRQTFVANQSTYFHMTLQGTGLTSRDRLRVIPKGIPCPTQLGLTVALEESGVKHEELTSVGWSFVVKDLRTCAAHICAHLCRSAQCGARLRRSACIYLRRVLQSCANL